jgi:hypothetical protein
MPSMSCPKCGKRIKLISFGNAWIGLCDAEIVYNSCELPLDVEPYASRSVNKGVRSDSPSPSPIPQSPDPFYKSPTPISLSSI